jgi:hypothetical protein
VIEPGTVIEPRLEVSDQEGWPAGIISRAAG